MTPSPARWPLPQPLASRFASDVGAPRSARSGAVSAAAGFALVLLLSAPVVRARNMMSADGPGGTYELLRTAYTTELPDCGHMVPHITEEMDADLGKNVFVFHAHANLDDDRCGGKDRQRTEIRAAAADIVASNGETVYYRWKFKLATGFQGSPSFTHIFQIKSDLGAPILTLTPRVSTFGMTGRGAGPEQIDLAKLVGIWVVVDLKVLYADSGRVEINIRRLTDGQVLFSHAGAHDMWDANASAHDSKFGIYRSLNNRGMLRDEQVRFADFCASKQSAADCEDGAVPPSDGGAGMGTMDAATAPDAGENGGGSGGSGSGGSGSGGNDGSGGSGGSGTGTSGGAPGSGGSGGSGTGTSGGAPGTGASGGSRGGGTAPPAADPSTGAGCSCSLAAAEGASQGLSAHLLLAFGFALRLWRRRRN